MRHKNKRKTPVPRKKDNPFDGLYRKGLDAPGDELERAIREAELKKKDRRDS